MTILHLKNKATIRGRFRIKTYKAGTKQLLRQTDWIENLIMLGTNTGLNIFLKRLLGTKLYNPEITQAKIGTGDTAPADDDTDLETTVLAGILISKSTEESVGVVTFEFFMSDADLTEGTYKEFGIFCTDQLFARSLILPVYTKSAGEDSQVEYEITLTNS